MAETDEVRGLIQDWEDMLTSKLYWRAAAKRAEADRVLLLEALRDLLEWVVDSGLEPVQDADGETVTDGARAAIAQTMEAS